MRKQVDFQTPRGSLVALVEKFEVNWRTEHVRPVFPTLPLRIFNGTEEKNIQVPMGGFYLHSI